MQSETRKAALVSREPCSLSDRMSEDDVHRAVVEHLIRRPAPGVAWFHPANGGVRHISTAARFKRLGVRAGIPDLALVIGGGAHFLELKRAKGGRLSPEQKAMRIELEEAGAVVAVAAGLDAAIATLEAWGALSRNL